MDLLYWSCLPGLAKKIKWPVKIDDWTSGESDVVVYCKSDDAYFKVKREQLVMFGQKQPQFEEIKNKSIAALKRKKTTLEAFLADVDWAIEASQFVEGNKVGKRKRSQSQKSLKKSRMRVKKSPACGPETSSTPEPRITSPLASKYPTCEPAITHSHEPKTTTFEPGSYACETESPSDKSKASTFETEMTPSGQPNNFLCEPQMTPLLKLEISSFESKTSTCEPDASPSVEPKASTSETEMSPSCEPETSTCESDVCPSNEPKASTSETEITPSCQPNNLFEPDMTSSFEPKASTCGPEFSPSDEPKTSTSEAVMATSCESWTAILREPKIIHKCDLELTPVNDLDMTLPCQPDKTSTFELKETCILDLSVNPICETEVTRTSELEFTTMCEPEKTVEHDSQKISPCETGYLQNEPEQNLSSCDLGCKTKKTLPCEAGKNSTCESNFLECEFQCEPEETSTFEAENNLPSESEVSSAGEDCLSDGSEWCPPSHDSHTSESEEFPFLNENIDLNELKGIGYDETDTEPDTCSTCDDNGKISGFLKGRKAYSVLESEMEFDIKNPKIYTRKLLNSHVSKFGKLKKRDTVWNQAHACKYCQKVVTNITKHLKKHMKTEKEVQDVQAMGSSLGKCHKSVRAKWDLIRNKGDHDHNKKVLESGAGEIILGRRQKGTFDVSKYGPCPKCFVWIQLDKTLCAHQSLCPGRNESDSKLSKRELRIASLVEVGRVSATASKALKEEVFKIMTADQIGKTAMQDETIIMLGNIWMTKNIGNKLKRKYYASSRMRDAARLLINLKNESGEDLDMQHFLSPDYFDTVVKAALNTASPNFDDYEDLKSPSTCIKLGYDIKRMISAKLGIAIKENNKVDREACLDFLKLMEMEWSLKVTKLASITLQVRRFNKEKTLPDPEDILKLSQTVKAEIMQIEAKLSWSDSNIFRRAVMLAETRLLLYNKRRAGEIEGIRVQQYVARKCGVDNIDKAMRTDMTKLEQKLLESQEVIETRGKYGRGVPVIIPQDCKTVLCCLASATVRHASGIRDDNPYLFPNSNVGVLRSYDSLKTLCSEIDLKSPEQITSVNLRKYTATISQVLDLSQQEQTWLVNHLGHSMDIHKIHYRQTSGTIERIDIAKIMLLQEFNLTAKYAGKQLKDIDLKELAVDSDGNVSLADRDIEDTGAVYNTIAADDTDGYIPDMEKIPDGDEYTFDDHGDEDSQKQKKKKAGTRIAWTPEEVAEIRKYFKSNIDAAKTPGRKQCEIAIKESKRNGGSIHKRNWETLKKKVWNILQKTKP